MQSKRKTTRDPLRRWRSFANRDSLQDMFHLEQDQTPPNPDPMQGAVDALEKALAATRARKEASEWAATAAIEKARASARRGTKGK